MAKKIINTTQITNELEGASLFFNKPPQDHPQPNEIPLETPQSSRVGKDISEGGQAEKQLTEPMIPRHHDTTIPRYHDTTVENIRRAVKQFGKEAATHRFTTEEKTKVRDLIYTYGSQGIVTSENEIARIAINGLIEDYKENGEESLLAKVLKKLKE